MPRSRGARPKREMSPSITTGCPGRLARLTGQAISPLHVVDRLDSEALARAARNHLESDDGVAVAEDDLAIPLAGRELRLDECHNHVRFAVRDADAILGLGERRDIGIRSAIDNHAVCWTELAGLHEPGVRGQRRAANRRVALRISLDEPVSTFRREDSYPAATSARATASDEPARRP